ncbi:hypothetical protein nbrc107696_02330 [Gordonia spumicola]|uniref:Uncharacterized protein n=2 Tax=Gordonia spumicola TaxID=589161 RepID=A0A7I9V3J5_9ACTN|nr:hypothetical protein nbrc107696_02330 [Gordonia spumicola]
MRSAEHRWPAVCAAVAYVIGMPVVAIACFGLSLAATYSFSGNAMVLVGFVCGTVGLWGYRRLVRSGVALLRRRIVAVGDRRDGTVVDVSNTFRPNPRGADIVIVSITIRFAADPTDPALKSREQVTLTRRFSFNARDRDDVNALIARYRIGTPVTAYRGRRGLLYTTGLHPDHLAWYQFW